MPAAEFLFPFFLLSFQLLFSPLSVLAVILATEVPHQSTTDSAQAWED